MSVIVRKIKVKVAIIIKITPGKSPGIAVMVNASTASDIGECSIIIISI
jgi:hypothetical protein